MKISIIQPRVSYYNGGGERRPLRLIQEMVKRTNIEVELYTTKPVYTATENYINFKNNTHGKVTIFEYDVPLEYRYLYDIQPGSDRSRWNTESRYFNQLILADLIKNKSDAIWSHYLYDVLDRPTDRPNILNLGGYPRDMVVEDSLFDSFDATVSISKNVEFQWNKILHRPLRRNFVVYPAANINKEPKLIDGLFLNKGPNIVFVGRLIERKGLQTLFKSLRLLKDKNYILHLYILGDGPFRASLEKLMCESGLEDVVHFLGHVEYPEDYFMNADMCIFPSYDGEGLMNVVMEAMYCGGVVITTENNANEEIITNHSDGLIIPQKDEQALMRAILFVLKNQEWAVDARKAARIKIMKDFTWGRHIASLQETLHKIIFT
ncbi:MAG: glycosyltransferase family 4 protein [Candidatus Taylorbacteria bacterium]|nr:glycosyltransferase family 4 protein [Candidatus Taylorbacteria bacterium]